MAAVTESLRQRGAPCGFLWSRRGLRDPSTAPVPIHDECARGQSCLATDASSNWALVSPRTHPRTPVQMLGLSAACLTSWPCCRGQSWSPGARYCRRRRHRCECGAQRCTLFVQLGDEASFPVSGRRSRQTQFPAPGAFRTVAGMSRGFTLSIVRQACQVKFSCALVANLAASTCFL